MARAPIPHALEMRRLKYGEATAAERAAVAEALLAQGRRSEVLLLLERHPDPAAFERERRWAIAQGDSFHLLSLKRLGAPVSPDDLRALAQVAEEKGRLRDAIQCHRALEDPAAAQRLRARLDAEEGRTPPPPPDAATQAPPPPGP